jgi:hypothetical protein
VLGAGEDRSIAPARRRLIAAQRAAEAAFRAAGALRCSDQPFNTVILPPKAPEQPTLVYLLTPQTDMDVIPVGGHYRVEVGADGKAGPLHPFSKSCLAMPLRMKGKPEPEAIVVSHLLDPVPTELHVFSSFAARKLLMVITVSNKRVWGVAGNSIRLAGVLDK